MIALIFLVLPLGCANGVPDLAAGPPRQATTVIVLGGLHGKHLHNPAYSPEILRDILVELDPDVVLWELPMNAASRKTIAWARVLPDIIYDKYPELWAVASAANRLDIQALPFDWSRRDEFYDEERYHQRSRAAVDVMEAWSASLASEDSTTNLVELIDRIRDGERALSEEGSPRINNSAARDALSAARHLLLYRVAPAGMSSSDEHRDAANELRWLYHVWEHRNAQMARNIQSIIEERRPDRVVIVTGVTHRYSLIPLLRISPRIVVKEYWELSSRP